MLDATITGGITSALQRNDEGTLYITVHSDQARRSVRALIRNKRHAEMVENLAKYSRLTVTGPLLSRGAVGQSGEAVALLSINVQSIKIHEATA